MLKIKKILLTRKDKLQYKETYKITTKFAKQEF